MCVCYMYVFHMCMQCMLIFVYTCIYASCNNRKQKGGKEKNAQLALCGRKTRVASPHAALPVLYIWIYSLSKIAIMCIYTLHGRLIAPLPYCNRFHYALYTQIAMLNIIPIKYIRVHFFPFFFSLSTSFRCSRCTQCSCIQRI